MHRSAITLDEFKHYNMKVEEFKKAHFGHIKEVYLDHAGSAIYSHLHISNFMEDLDSNIYGNPHSKNISSKRTIDIVEEVRIKVLQHFNATPQEYSTIFVQNSSAAFNLVATCFKFATDDEANTWAKISRRKIGFEKESLPPHDVITNNDKVTNCQGVLVYLNDNHTSVVGMRGPAGRKGARSFCLDEAEVQRELNLQKFSDEKVEKTRNNLFVFPAQSNFSGRRYPLSWINMIQERERFMKFPGKWRVLLDAASILTTSTIDLSIFKPDFLACSFYKIFGFPTGLGCLLVKNSSQNTLEKCYFGGGTIDVLLPSHKVEVFRSNFSERFEDGTLPYLEILSVKHGFDALYKITGSFADVSWHTFALASYAYKELKSFSFSNEQKVAELYHDTEFESMEVQGPIVNFNILKTDGSHLGFFQVGEMAKLQGISLRTGCFCNVGACQKFLGISSQDLVDNYNLGHVCGDGVDLIGLKPTGSVRVSFGFSSTLADVESFLKFIRVCFVDKGNSMLEQDSDKVLGFQTTEGLNLKEIWIYPIKSCCGMQMDKCTIDARGLKGDRKWMVINQSGRTLTQKDTPELCKIKCILHQDNLKVQHESFQDLIVDFCDQISTTTFANECVGRICGDTVSVKKHDLRVNDWFSSVLKTKDLLLVNQNENDKRASRKDPDFLLSFANEAQFLLIGSASLEILHKKVISGGNFVCSLEELSRRFRANFVANTLKPFEEESWVEIKIGKNTFKKVGLCNRCKMICFDQTSAVVTKEPLLTLMNLPGRKTHFGILLAHVASESEVQASVSVGDVIEILKYK